ncbi:zinc-alpha-2-glycoprotein-like [Osmerus eperlanus]|uniref:zinc-alpha-2-glycoprotein-like n=1 Tax=Osmerus eperlanus TaxID=29151 RepID=UPI002E118200
MKLIWMILMCISLLISAAESEVHTLEYLSVMYSKPGNQSQYQQVIMFDGISISHCETANSGEKLRRRFEDNQPSFNMKLQESIQDCSNEVWDFRNSFVEISHLTNIGVDLIQRQSGCTYSSDQESNSTFDNWAVNGTDFLTFNSNSRTWKSESPLAVPVERKWNSADIHKNKLVWFLKDDCPSILVLILKRRQEMIATNTDITIFGKPLPQNDSVSQVSCYKH